MTTREVALYGLGWGTGLWFIGYLLGIVFYMILPKDLIGWAILPIGVLITVLVLMKKIRRLRMAEYVMLSFLWTVMAVVLDYIFIVRAFSSADYYKLDVYVYYGITALLPLIIGSRQAYGHSK